jgi:hypothetical protein
MAARGGNGLLAGLGRSGGIDWHGQILTHLLHAYMHATFIACLRPEPTGSGQLACYIFFVVLPNKRQLPCIRSALPIDRPLLSG